MQDNIKVLLEIGKKTGLFRQARVTTTKISEKLGVSQQSISRKLKVLEDEGYISRVTGNRGLEIKLREKGRKELKQVYESLTPLFEKKEIIGKITDGLGEGKFYTTLPNYVEQFRKKLGFKPHPGTLNLKTDEASIKEFLSQKHVIKIDGYKTRERTFGNIKAYKTMLNGEKIAVVIPERSSHPNHILEIIAPFHIRSKFHLGTGDKVKIK